MQMQNLISVKSLSFLSLPGSHGSRQENMRATFWRPALTFSVISALFSCPLDAFCQSLFDIMENTPGLSFFWNTVKSLLQGKVLYAPDTPAARLIVKEVRSGKRLKCGEM